MVQRNVREHVGWLEILVDDPGFVQLAERGCEANRTAKKLFQLHRPWNQSIERVPSWVLEHEHGPVLLLSESDGLNRPCRIEFVFKREYVLYLLNGCRGGVLHHRGQNENRRRANL